MSELHFLTGNNEDWVPLLGKTTFDCVLQQIPLTDEDSPHASKSPVLPAGRTLYRRPAGTKNVLCSCVGVCVHVFICN